jgi:hypothetical protein
VKPTWVDAALFLAVFVFLLDVAAMAAATSLLAWAQLKARPPRRRRRRKPAAKGLGGARYNCALAAAVRIVNRQQDQPNATTPEMLSFATYTILEAIYGAERRLGGLPAAPSAD